MPSVPGLHGSVVRVLQFAVVPLLPPELPPLLLPLPLPLLVLPPLLLPPLLPLVLPLAPPLLLLLPGPLLPDEQPIPPCTERTPPAIASRPPSVFQSTGFIGTTSQSTIVLRGSIHSNRSRAALGGPRMASSSPKSKRNEWRPVR
jgi:hypothetical protein